MKKLIPVILSSLSTAVLFAGPGEPATAPTDPASAEQVRAESPALWIAVHLPKETRPAWVGDALAESFADRLSRALRDQGLKGTIGTLRPEDPPPPLASVLEVNLTEWNTRAGSGDCTFRASLRAPEGLLDLGLFSGEIMIVTADGGQRVSSSGLRNAAHYAMADLYNRIVATKLLASP